MGRVEQWYSEGILAINRRRYRAFVQRPDRAQGDAEDDRDNDIATR